MAPQRWRPLRRRRPRRSSAANGHRVREAGFYRIRTSAADSEPETTLPGGRSGAHSEAAARSGAQPLGYPPPYPAARPPPRRSTRFGAAARSGRKRVVPLTMHAMLADVARSADVMDAFLRPAAKCAMATRMFPVALWKARRSTDFTY